MSNEVSNNLLDDVSITLEYTIKEVNALLTALAQLPFGEVVSVINSIHTQVGPQFEKAKASMDAVVKASEEAANESKTAS